jgi:biopolymer transport protein ExbB/TolQ
MDSPYTPPATPVVDIVGVTRSKRFFGRAAAISGLVVVILPLFGLIGTVKGMIGAFGTLGKTGSADPSALAGDISVALLATFWGFVFSVISFIPFAVFLVLFLRRRRILRELSTGIQRSEQGIAPNDR